MDKWLGCSFLQMGTCIQLCRSCSHYCHLVGIILWSHQSMFPLDMELDMESARYSSVLFHMPGKRQLHLFALGCKFQLRMGHRSSFQCQSHMHSLEDSQTSWQNLEGRNSLHHTIGMWTCCLIYRNLHCMDVVLGGRYPGCLLLCKCNLARIPKESRSVHHCWWIFQFQEDMHTHQHRPHTSRIV